MKEARLLEVLQVNLVAALYGTQALPPHTVARGKVSIINTASNAALAAATNRGAQGIAKARLVQLTPSTTAAHLVPEPVTR